MRSMIGATRTLLALGAAGEGATGLVLMTYPSVCINWLLGAELSAPGAALGRITGFALLALGVACWPTSRSASDDAAPVRAMLIYGLFAAVYLALLGFDGNPVGILLWPAVVVHSLFTVLLARAWYGRPS